MLKNSHWLVKRYVIMLSLVRLSLVLVSLLFVVHVSEAFPLKEWLLSSSEIDDVDGEKSSDVQRFDEDSYTRYDLKI